MGDPDTCMSRAVGSVLVVLPVCRLYLSHVVGAQEHAFEELQVVVLVGAPRVPLRVAIGASASMNRWAAMIFAPAGSGYSSTPGNASPAGTRCG